MVSDLKTFAHKGCKIAVQKKLVFAANFALLAGFFGILGPPYCGIGTTIRIGREMLCLPHAVFFFKVISLLIAVLLHIFVMLKIVENT